MESQRSPEAVWADYYAVQLSINALNRQIMELELQRKPLEDQQRRIKTEAGDVGLIL